jgi:hypothetical protein
MYAPMAWTGIGSLALRGIGIHPSRSSERPRPSPQTKSADSRRRFFAILQADRPYSELTMRRSASTAASTDSLGLSATERIGDQTPFL